ncbi:MAG: ubiquinone biosynthesis protein COQ7 [Clostridia bacterium]|nr:ubiquinone biosynthesis protein COQ7 [Clostridia bacterium]
MFNFNNNQNYPTYNNQNRRMTTPDNANDFETLQNARKDLVGELDAIIQYDDHLHKTDNELAKATWENIRNEELTHVGELLGLINYLAPYQKPFIERGLKEFNDRLQNK